MFGQILGRESNQEFFSIFWRIKKYCQGTNRYYINTSQVNLVDVDLVSRMRMRDYPLWLHCTSTQKSVIEHLNSNYFMRMCTVRD